MAIRGQACLSFAAVAALLLAAGCGARALDPGMSPSGTGGTGSAPPPDPVTPMDLLGALKAVKGPDQLLIVGSYAGAVITVSTRGPFTAFARDPESLDEAAAVVGLPVCSVEFQTLTFGPTSDDPTIMTVPDALDACLKEDLQDMLAKLGALSTPSTVVVVAANTAITDHTTNNGINYFYDGDIVKLLHAARKLYVPVCNISPAPLSLPTPQGQSAGVSIEDALASCGRM